MNCDDFQRELQAAVESRSPLPIEKWRDHLNACVSCRRRCEDHHLLDRAVQEWSQLESYPDLTESVLVDLKSPSSDSKLPKHRPTRVISLLAICSAMLLLAFLMQDGGDVPIANSPSGPSSRQNPLEPSRPKLPADVNLDRLLVETRGSYGSLVQEAQLSLQPLTQFVGEIEFKPVPAEDAPTSKPMQSYLPAELDPLKEELSQSFGFLAALMPDEKPAP